MRPQFNRDEEFLIAYYRQSSESTQTRAILQDVTTAAMGCLFLGLGLFKSDMTWALIGFGIVAFRLIRGTFAAARYSRTFATIVEKYELAVNASPDTPEAADPFAGDTLVKED